MDDHPNISPWHPGCGLSVNKIWEATQKGQERSVVRTGVLRILGAGRKRSLPEQRLHCPRPTEFHYSPKPRFKLLETFRESSLTFKRPVQVHPVLGDQIAIVLAQPEEVVVREVWGGCRVWARGGRL
jgi:hypothetical protein